MSENMTVAAWEKESERLKDLLEALKRTTREYPEVHQFPLMTEKERYRETVEKTRLALVLESPEGQHLVEMHARVNLAVGVFVEEIRKIEDGVWAARQTLLRKIEEAKTYLRTAPLPEALL